MEYIIVNVVIITKTITFPTKWDVIDLLYTLIVRTERLIGKNQYNFEGGRTLLCLLA